MCEGAVLKMLCVPGTFGPLHPAEQHGQKLTSTHSSLYAPASSGGRWKSGILNNHWKNTRPQGRFLEWRPILKQKLPQKPTVSSHESLQSSLRIFRGDPSLLIPPSRSQQAGSGEPRTSWPSSAQPVTRHGVAVLGFCISTPTCTPWCHGACVVSWRALYMI